MSCLTWTKNKKSMKLVVTVRPILILMACTWFVGNILEDMETLQQLTVPKMVKRRSGRIM